MTAKEVFEMATEIMESVDDEDFTVWEIDFLESMQEQFEDYEGRPTPKQIESLRKIHKKYME